MTVYYYECQEQAMAPGIADGWPKVIPAPHTANGRLVRRDGDPAKMRGEIDNLLAAIAQSHGRPGFTCRCVYCERHRGEA